jgi:hypothetical protein
VTLGNLAGTIKRGFDGADKHFDGVNNRLDRVEKNLSILRENSAREHEEIKLRLGNVAYRFYLV